MPAGGGGRLSEKSNIPQRESKIRFWPCIGVRGILVSRGFSDGLGGGEASGDFGMRSLVSVPASRSFKRCFEQGLRPCK